MTRTPLEELEARGIIDQLSNRDGVAHLLEAGGASFYIGYDPTARSLHVGHLLPILTMARLQRMGARPIVLVGGATGMVGDPSGRSAERSTLSREELEDNKREISHQLARFVDFSGVNAAIMVDNADWITPISLLEWLRDVGKLFTVNYMLAKESVRRRLEDREQGISYTEFTYMLLQAYDFLHLFERESCLLQVGGSDQWGNITAGIDLVRKIHGQEVFGLTLPLLTSSSGEKFGKSAGNSVWLDPEQTSPYQFFQYWVNQEDADAERLLKLFTSLAIEEIDALLLDHRAAPERRVAQRALAREVTRAVHGDEHALRAERASEALFAGNISGLTAHEVFDVLSEAPSSTVAVEECASGIPIVDLLVRSSIVSSRAEGRRLIDGGGLYLNEKRVDISKRVTSTDLDIPDVLILRTGKRCYHLIHVRG